MNRWQALPDLTAKTKSAGIGMDARILHLCGCKPLSKVGSTFRKMPTGIVWLKCAECATKGAK